VPQAVDVNDVVTHVCGICQSQIFEKGIQLTCDLANDAGCVTADPARLQQVLWNVLKNAAKFTPQGGKIDVSTRRRGDRGAGDRVAIVVRDNGAGIAQSILPRVFDAFEQGDVRVTRQFGGLGLGLAISKALVELHTGTIRAESNGEGCGSTFTIELPSRVSALKPRPEPREATGSSKPAGARLLVVEDHPDTAMLLGKLLRAAGYDVRTSLSAAGALSMASSEPFDLLISDIGLPDATGYELMQQLRERSGIDGKVLGIAMSGYGMDEDIKRSQEAGFSEHLVKPIDVAQLEDAIRRILEVPASAS
jgi:CheY-like chemotaxis protein